MSRLPTSLANKFEKLFKKHPLLTSSTISTILQLFPCLFAWLCSVVWPKFDRIPILIIWFAVNLFISVSIGMAALDQHAANNRENRSK